MTKDARFQHRNLLQFLVTWPRTCIAMATKNNKFRWFAEGPSHIRMLIIWLTVFQQRQSWVISMVRHQLGDDRFKSPWFYIAMMYATRESLWSWRDLLLQASGCLQQWLRAKTLVKLKWQKLHPSMSHFQQ